MAYIPVLALFGFLAIVIVGGYWSHVAEQQIKAARQSKLDDMEATLKMEMIQRGMTSEDIERVLTARMGAEPSTNEMAKTRAWFPPRKSAKV